MKKPKTLSKKLPSLTSLRNKADKCLQQKVAKLNKRCEVCGKPQQVGHHIFPKSVSSRLRYDLDNLSPLCNGCHMRHHMAGDPKIQATIIQNHGGQVWFDQLTIKSREYQKVDRYYYLEAIERLSK